MKYFIITFIISLICNTHLICQDRLPFSIKIIKDSREIIMVQDKPWEEQMIGYYKVLKTNKKNGKCGILLGIITGKAIILTI